MREKLSVELTTEELQELNQRILDAELSPTEVARRYRPRMNMNYMLMKLRGDANFSKSQYAKVLKVIEAAEAHIRKISEAVLL